MNDQLITSLSELKNLRSAPILSKSEEESLFNQLVQEMREASWFTLGIMAPSSEKALLALRQVESCFEWENMQTVENPSEKGEVFLKANQRTGEIRIRIEWGLGEGILISGQNSDSENGKPCDTWGPFPLDFFNK